MQKYFDFITDDLVQAAVGLSGGGGTSVAGSCGTFSAGLMALSRKLSPRPDNPSETDRKAYEHAKSVIAEFRDWFLKEFGGVTCRDVQFRVLGRVYNLMDETQMQDFRAYQEQTGKYCNQVSRKVALKIAGMLLRE